MSAAGRAPARKLRIVDLETGEIQNGCPECAALQDVVAGLERDIRGWAKRYADLKRDKDAEAREHPRWPEMVEAFKHWKKVCRHPRSAFTADRFWLCLPYLEKHGIEMVKRAIDGAAFDPFKSRRRNGTTQRHDGWELIFRDALKFEDFVNRAPLEGKK